MPKGRLESASPELDVTSNLRGNRVKRSELFQEEEGVQSTHGSEASSRSASPIHDNDHHGAGDNGLKVDYGFDYDFITPDSVPKIPPTAHKPDAAADEEQEEEPEYQFHLFTSASKPTTTDSDPTTSIAKAKSTIRLSLTPPPDPAGLSISVSLDRAEFVQPNRPDGYYFTSAFPRESVDLLRSQYAEVAVSSSDVLYRAITSKWPGAAMPWRLIPVQLANRVREPRISNKVLPSSKRGRPSKKRRILQRRRLALRAELAAQAQKAEETEREKRTRRNREKKVKRKEREKRKKVEAKADGTLVDLADKEESAGDDDED
jgi:hypothetical protein